MKEKKPENPEQELEKVLKKALQELKQPVRMITENRLFRKEPPFTKEQSYLIIKNEYVKLVKERNFECFLTPQIDECLKAVAKYFNNQIDKEKSLLFLGLPGNGKSTMLKAIAHTVPILAKTGLVRPLLTMPIIPANNFKQLNFFKNATILGIDDMGIEPAMTNDFGTVRTPLNEVLEHRYNRQLLTVISSNLTNEQIIRRYDYRISDRFNEMFNVVIFKHDSFRHIEQLKLKEIKL